MRSHLSVFAVLKKRMVCGLDRAAVILSLFFVTCNATAVPLEVGVVKFDGDGKWHLYSTKALTAGDRILVQYPGRGNTTECCITASLKGARQEQVDLVVTDELGGQDVWRYELKPPSRRVDSPFIGIAVIGNVAKAQVRGISAGTVHVDGGAPVIVNSCLGTEGVNVLARKEGKLIAWFYFYLDYSVAPTCTDELPDEEETDA